MLIGLRREINDVDSVKKLLMVQYNFINFKQFNLLQFYNYKENKITVN